MTSVEEKVDVSASPQWKKFTVTYATFSAASTTGQKAIYTLPAGAVVHATKIRQITPFTGGAISAYTISLGTVASAALLAAASNVFDAASATNFDLAEVPTSEILSLSHSAAATVYAKATSTGANLNAATAGKAELWLLVSQAT